MGKSDFIEELQMITGVLTNDLNYLLYLLLKDGRKSNEIEKSEYVESTNDFNLEGLPEDLSDWFNQMEEVK